LPNGTANGEVTERSQDALLISDVWTMENAARWTIVQGSATKTTSTTHSEGSSSLSLTSTNGVSVKGAAVSKPSAPMSQQLGIDVMIPNQAGPSSWGTVQLQLDAPAEQVNGVYLGQVALAPPKNTWQTVAFTIPQAVYNKLSGSSFADLAVTIKLNPMGGNGGAFLFDNLRFLPVAGCAGQTNGSLCDDAVACSSGNTCLNGVCGSATAFCDLNAGVRGFENPLGWAVSNGTASLTASNTKHQGDKSLSVVAPFYTTITSIQLATEPRVSNKLGLWVQIPTSQPNSGWHGEITLNLSVPGLSINSSQTVPLLNLPTGSWVELFFTIPNDAYTKLANAAYSSLYYSITINPPSGQTGAYLLDDLHYEPVASCSGLPNHTACDDNNPNTQGDECFNGTCGLAVNTAAPHTPLAGFQYNGIQENIKYFDAGGNVCEVYFTQGDPGVDWHFSDLTDQVGGPVAAPDSAIAAFETSFDSPPRQHVVYQTAQSPSHIYELMYGNNHGPWSTIPKDLTADAALSSASVLPKAGSPLAGYETTTNGNQLHVDFIDTQGNAVELWFDSNFGDHWHKTDLWTDAQNGLQPPPATLARPTAVNVVGYLTPYNNQKHVIFINQDDKKLYEYFLTLDDSHWRFNSLPLPASGALAIPTGPLSAYVTTYDDTHQQHVDYLGGTSGTDVHLFELEIAEGATTWTVRDLNAFIASGTVVPASSSLTGYQTTYTSPPQQHVDFIDANNHVQELVLDKGATTWRPNDLTALATDFATGQQGPPNVPLAAPGSHLTGYPTTWNNVQHVVFTTSSAELYELYYLNNQWNGNSLTPLGFWPAAGSYSGTLQVEIRDQASGRTIHFTTDGSPPTASSPVYTGPITVSTTTTIKALATSSGGNGAAKQASATYTIAAGSTTTPVAAVVTTNNGTHKMDSQSGVGFTSGTGGTNVIHVDENTKFQQIEGFGASFTDTSATLLNQVASANDRATAMQNLFSPTQGIGISFIRNPLGASDFALDFYTYADLASGTDGLANFTIAHDLVNIVPLVQQAKSLNSNLKIMANPWSPPEWMKTPATKFGNAHLIATSDNYDSFANYLVKSIQAYAAQSINIDYISIQNEPLFATPDYPGMLMDPPEQAPILTDHLIPALRKNGLSTKVLVYDHNWNHPEYPRNVLNDIGSSNLVNFPELVGIAWHGYSGTADAMTPLHTDFPGLGQYVTEHSIRITAVGALMKDDATNYDDQIDQDFEEIITTMRNWAKSYVKWNLAENENNGPRVPGGPNGAPGGCKECTPILVVNSSSGAVWYSLQYYTLGHFSKYVHPGATRIYSNDISIDIVDPNDPTVVISKGTGLWNAAFLNPDGSKAMVVYNGTTATNTFQVQWGSQVLTYSLPGKSGVTLTWNGTQN
jgi:glucosylceramidase